MKTTNATEAVEFVEVFVSLSFGIVMQPELFMSIYKEDDAVKINVSGNQIVIDTYVYFTGDVDLTTGNGTPCKDLAIPTTYYNSTEWSNARLETIKMYIRDSRNDVPLYTDEKHLRTITHEMGHVFGIDDGYEDEDDPNGRKDAYNVLKIIDETDVMRLQFNKLNISSTDIGMLILAYWKDEFQAYSTYGSRKESEYISIRGAKE